MLMFQRESREQSILISFGLFNFEEEKKKKDTIESFIEACKSGKTDEWKSENKDKEKEKDTFWF